MDPIQQYPKPPDVREQRAARAREKRARAREERAQQQFAGLSLGAAGPAGPADPTARALFPDT